MNTDRAQTDRDGSEHRGVDEQTDRTTSRLDKQAAAIKRLRTDRDLMRSEVENLTQCVNALLARIEMLEVSLGAQVLADVARADRQGARSSTEPEPSRDVWAGPEILPVLPMVEQGTWPIRAECLCCGGDRAGSRSMTCRRCVDQRKRAIRGEIARPRFPQCLNCGTASKGGGGMQYLCVLCRGAAKRAGF